MIKFELAFCDAASRQAIVNLTNSDIINRGIFTRFSDK